MKEFITFTYFGNLILMMVIPLYLIYSAIIHINSEIFKSLFEQAVGVSIVMALVHIIIGSIIIVKGWEL